MMRGHLRSMGCGTTCAVVGILVFMCLPELALVGFFMAGALLSSFAEMPRQVDAVVVLGGDWTSSGVTNRYSRGRDLVLAGYSKRLILISPGAAEVRDAQARGLDVYVVDPALARNTWEEAKIVRAYMESGGLRSVMVVSDPPHMLRLRYTWESLFCGTGLTYVLIATDPSWWSAWRWWRNPKSADFVDNEVLKLGYYIVKYRFGF